ncbi:MAG: DNA-processing protein DprA [Akkermansiaceae bacterium]|nr:DNA-processing protein DprA [Akkermansiaceae bacterium]
MSPLEALVALNMLPGIGPIRRRRLIDAFGNASKVLSASSNTLLEVRGIGPELAATLLAWRQHIDPGAEIAECQARGISIITQEDGAYPPQLRELYDAPLLLYCQGELPTALETCIGVVGSRRCSHYGLQTTRKFSYQLAASGHAIVSGLARGIDTAAHEAAIAADGKTVAIIGSGLARLYPPENEALAERIASGHGAVVSEYPLHTRPDKGTFPMRNRIIAGWSQALLVVECPPKSGGLITANLAGDYGRPLFVVPGPIDRNSFAGSHRLIRDGASLVSDASEILEDMGVLPTLGTASRETRPESASVAIDATLSRILEELGSMETTVDQLVERCALPTAVISRSLASLEIQGMVKSCPGSRFVRIA